jgi:hypothetical protein
MIKCPIRLFPANPREKDEAVLNLYDIFIEGNVDCTYQFLV